MSGRELRYELLQEAPQGEEEPVIEITPGVAVHDMETCDKPICRQAMRIIRARELRAVAGRRRRA